MWLVWTTAAFSAGLVILCLAQFREDWRSVPRGWQLLALSGVALSLGGMEFILRFWAPLPGPYTVNQTYPLGRYLNAWAVSFGFMWVAFGVTIVIVSLRGDRGMSSWLGLLIAWVLAWLPHGIIIGGFLLAGHIEPNAQLYADWAAQWPGSFSLWISGLILITHVGLGIAGFFLTGRALLRSR